MAEQSFRYFEIRNSLNALTDEQLMECYLIDKNGQGAMAFDHLYFRYARRMIDFFYFSLNNNADKAQDFLHDLFLKVIENRTKFDKNCSFQAWIYRMASNMCKNDFRSHAVHQKYLDERLTSPESTLPDNEAEISLRTCIKSLDQDQRSLIVLRFKINLTIREMAEIYGCPEGTVKSRLFYAIKELSKLYKKQDHENQ
jgi:RNA polymerase sigma-70 factor (ECF subfamily)